MRYRLDRRSLDKWKNREGRTFAWLARQVGVKTENLYQLLHGSHGPSLAAVLALSEITGIPVESLVRRIDEESMASAAG